MKAYSLLLVLAALSLAGLNSCSHSDEQANLSPGQEVIKTTSPEKTHTRQKRLSHTHFNPKTEIVDKSTVSQ